MIVVAFDPGLTGAVASLETALPGRTGKHELIAAEVRDLPTMGAGKQVVLNGAALAADLRAMRAQHALLEAVQAFPNQGLSSSQRTGIIWGQILGILQAAQIPYEIVKPSKWKKEMRLGSDKEVSRGRALELFPSLHEQLARKKDHDRAEALLLARWWVERQP